MVRIPTQHKDLYDKHHEEYFRMEKKLNEMKRKEKKNITYTTDKLVHNTCFTIQHKFIQVIFLAHLYKDA